MTGAADAVEGEASTADRPSLAGPGRVAPAPDGDEDEGRRYLAAVMGEIDQEVRSRRSSGDLPPRVERELDELFLAHSPVSGRGAGLSEALRMVDASAFIDPVVPVASSKSGGAFVKRGLRQLSLWYMGYVTHQVSQFATAVSRSLHLLGEQVEGLGRQLDAQRVPPCPVLDVGWAHSPDAWWVPAATSALAVTGGRVLHAACGDGWLVRALRTQGVDAYGVDPRDERVRRSESESTDLREERLLDHLRAAAPAGLGGLVLTGVVEGMVPGEREQLLELICDRLAPGGVLLVHSISPAAWSRDDLPPEADLAAGRPLRPRTWSHLLASRGFEVRVHPGADRAPGPEASVDGPDFLVQAVLRGEPLAGR